MDKYLEVRGKLGGIACPPELLSLISQPSRTIESLACLCTIVSNSIPEPHDHFGKSEHSYGHWLELPLVEGEFQLWQILQEYPAAADPASPDVAPLRLMPWLNLMTQVTHFLKKR